jgi:hypothetical protein
MLKSHKIMYLAHLWLNNVTNLSAVGITGFNQKTITSFYCHFCNLVASTLEEEDQIIGGPGIVVEVDETKLGKQKYNKGHCVDGIWVVVGVEHTQERRIFMLPVENRNALTLMTIIQDHVALGSVIHTDCWKGYGTITDESDMTHLTVNHSQCFKDPTTNVHSNTVEGTNNTLKMKALVCCHIAERVNEHLLEFVWRRVHVKSLWNLFMAAIKGIHYDL